MKKHKSLTPLALALPGLLATCAYGSYANYPTTVTPGGNWSASANSSGYTTASYSGSAIALYELISGYNTANPNTCDYYTKTMANNVTAVTLSYTWTSNSYSTGECNLSDQKYGYGGFNPNGADASVWNGAFNQCL